MIIIPICLLDLGRTKIDLKFGLRLFKWANMALLLLFRFVWFEVELLELLFTISLLLSEVMSFEYVSFKLETPFIDLVIFKLISPFERFSFGRIELLYGWLRKAFITTTLFCDFKKKMEN